MIRVFLLLLASAAGFWYLADILKQKGPGFVWIYFNHYSLETSFWFFMALLIGSVIGFYFLIKLSGFLFYHLVKLGFLPKRRNSAKRQALYSQSLLAFAEGHYLQAENLYAKLLKKKPKAFVQMVIASRSCLAVGNIEQAKIYAADAAQCEDVDKLHLQFLALDIASFSADDGEARSICSELLENYPKDTTVKARVFRFYCESQRFEKAEELLAKVKKSQFFNTDIINAYECKIVSALAEQYLRQANHKQLEALYKNAHKIPSCGESVELSYMQLLLQQGEADKVSKMLKQQVKDKAYSYLAQSVSLLYRQQEQDSYNSLLQMLEKVNEKEQSNANYFYAAAKLAEVTNQAERAEIYYLQSLKLAHNNVVIKELARFFKAQQRYAEAAEYFELALLQMQADA